MTRNIIALIGLVLLVGCSGGGGEDSAAPSPSTSSTPTAQPDMLVATSDGLWRGQATGKGGLIFAHANLQRETVLVNEGNVVYSRTLGTPSRDIWNVRADGTEDHALVNTKDDEHLWAVNGPWVVYGKQIETPIPGGVGTSSQQQQWSLRMDTGAQFRLANDWWPMNVYFHGADRVIFQMDHEIFSETVTGTGRIQHAEFMDVEMSAARIVGSALTYAREDISGQPDAILSQLFAVPLAGGATVPLDSDQFSTYSYTSIGNRVVYQRCTPPYTPCDVVSIEADGTDRVVLASHPANEAVQGVTADRVIIRRNLAGSDQLIAVPVAGGAEKLLMTMTDNEFVDLIVGDLLIVRRPSGTWSLDLNGTLTKLGTVVGDSGFIAVGGSVCLNKGTAVWCMPLDGQGQAVKIANDGKVVGVL